MDTKKLIIGITCLAAVALQTTYGAPIIGDDGGDGILGSSFDNWGIVGANANPTYGTFSPDVSLGGHASALEIVGGPASFFPMTDYVFNNATLGGDWGALGVGGLEAITFDFYSATSAPDALDLFFSEGSNQWHYIVPALSTGWSGYSADLDYSAGWYNISGVNDALTFGNSYAAVNKNVGIRLQYGVNETAQVYGIDNFYLNDAPVGAVPEPQTYAMLGFALCSVGMTFRRRLHGSLESLKAMLKG